MKKKSLVLVVGLIFLQVIYPVVSYAISFSAMAKILGLIGGMALGWALAVTLSASAIPVVGGMMAALVAAGIAVGGGDDLYTLFAATTIGIMGFLITGIFGPLVLLPLGGICGYLLACALVENFNQVRAEELELPIDNVAIENKGSKVEAITGEVVDEGADKDTLRQDIYRKYIEALQNKEYEKAKLYFKKLEELKRTTSK